MKNPSWYQEDATHKDMNYGNGLRIPVCKIAKRSEWPRDGVYSPFDKVTRIWKKVNCTHCLKFSKIK